MILVQEADRVKQRVLESPGHRVVVGALTRFEAGRGPLKARE